MHFYGLLFFMALILKLRFILFLFKFCNCELYLYVFSIYASLSLLVFLGKYTECYIFYLFLFLFFYFFMLLSFVIICVHHKEFIYWTAYPEAIWHFKSQFCMTAVSWDQNAESSLLGNPQSSGEAIYRLGEGAWCSANDIIIASCLVELFCDCQIELFIPYPPEAHSLLRGNYAPRQFSRSDLMRLCVCKVKYGWR